jgi:putative proteasome-type protease
MTYCLAILTQAGLIMAADSRTNAGVDVVSSAQKLFDFSLPGERIILLCNAGNLSLTQNILTLINRDLKTQTDINIHSLPTLYEIAQYVGRLTRSIIEEHQPWLKKDGIDARCSFLLGGQIKGEAPELYMIYSQGNFLRATKETPYFQIGEIKYGKPILDRVISYEDTTLEEATKCALLSIDSTMKSNISVGPPIHIILYEVNSFAITHRCKLNKGDPYLENIRRSWEESVKASFKDLPMLTWQPHTAQEEEKNWLAPSNVYTN